MKLLINQPPLMLSLFTDDIVKYRNVAGQHNDTGK
jgi:hypothetical protein